MVDYFGLVILHQTTTLQKKKLGSTCSRCCFKVATSPRQDSLSYACHVFHVFDSGRKTAGHHLRGTVLLTSMVFHSFRSFLCRPFSNKEQIHIPPLPIEQMSNGRVKTKMIGAENNAVVNRESSSNSRACISRSYPLVPCRSKVHPTPSGLARWKRTPSS